MKFMRSIFAIILLPLLIITGCGGGGNDTSHTKIETIFGMYTSHTNFKNVPEALEWMRSLGVTVYATKCGRGPRGNGIPESSYAYIEFEIDTFNLRKATASGEFYITTPLTLSDRAYEFSCM